jgi:hypothetical protein
LRSLRQALVVVTALLAVGSLTACCGPGPFHCRGGGWHDGGGGYGGGPGPGPGPRPGYGGGPGPGGPGPGSGHNHGY